VLSPSALIDPAALVPRDLGRKFDFFACVYLLRTCGQRGVPMYIIVDERSAVTGGYASSFDREGISSAGIEPAEFRDWIGKVSETDVRAIEAFLIGDCDQREVYPRLIRERSRAPVICLNERQSLDQTLGLFAAGVDDVLRKPVHVREILARVGAINRRNQGDADHVMIGDLCVFFDGRDPEIKGEPLPLPRRERRILEYIVSNRGRRVTKSQIFNSIYGLFDENVDENVVESHISKLRKKLKHRLGFDPIDSKRYLGYCLDRGAIPTAPADSAREAPAARWLASWPQGW
jgi:DNA-binding response OmpR family regulator